MSIKNKKSENKNNEHKYKKDKNNKSKNEESENKRNNSFLKYAKYILIGLVTGAANGLFGSGGGTIAVPSMVLLLGAEEHKAHATAIAIILPLTVVSAFMYIRSNFINWPLTLNVILGGIVGGFIGAKLLNKCPAKVLRKIFGGFMILAAMRMILWK